MNYVPNVLYDTQDPQFMRGFNAGRVWKELFDCHEGIEACPGHEATMCAENTEMAMRLGEATGHAATAHDLDDEWIRVRFDPA